jgi:hypothetical protein
MLCVVAFYEIRRLITVLTMYLTTRKLNRVYYLTFYFLQIYFNIVLLQRPVCQVAFFVVVFQPELCTPFPLHAHKLFMSCLPHLLDFNILIILCVQSV